MKQRQLLTVEFSDIRSNCALPRPPLDRQCDWMVRFTYDPCCFGIAVGGLFEQRRKWSRLYKRKFCQQFANVYAFFDTGIIAVARTFKLGPLLSCIIQHLLRGTPLHMRHCLLLFSVTSWHSAFADNTPRLVDWVHCETDPEWTRALTCYRRADSKTPTSRRWALSVLVATERARV